MKFKPILSVFLTVLILGLSFVLPFAPVPVAHASTFTAMFPPDFTVERLIAVILEAKDILIGMFSVAAIVTLAINYMKSKKWIPEGQADAIFRTANAVLLCLIAITRLFFPDFNLYLLNDLAGALLSAFAFIFPIGVIVNGSFGSLLHRSARGIPGVGESSTLNMVAARTKNARG